MSKWKEIKTYTEINPYNGQPVDEDAPANSVAGGGVDLSIDKQIDRKKKKRSLIDARSKSYKDHRKRLVQAREKRLATKEQKSKFSKKVQENIDEFKSINETPYDDLKSIVKDKQAKSLKFKDGSMKVDMTTANFIIKVLDKIKKPDLKKKVMNMLNTGKKSDFLKVHSMVMKVIK